MSLPLTALDANDTQVPCCRHQDPMPPPSPVTTAASHPTPCRDPQQTHATTAVKAPSGVRGIGIRSLGLAEVIEHEIPAA